MLVGLFLKNFKCYQGTQYVQIFESGAENFIGYLGSNGVGKSAILEGLDAFFSKKPLWIRNKESRKGSSECFVAPVFVISRDLLGENGGEPLEEISNSLKEFINTDFLKSLEEDKLVLCVTRREDGVFGFYDGKREIENEVAQEIHRILATHFQYIYIDAEVDIDQGIKINSDLAEILIGSPVVAEVEKKFKEIDLKDGLVGSLNAALEELIDKKLTSKLQKVDPLYTYAGTRGFFSKLTTNILARVSTIAFLENRKLKYKGRELDNLSSGQRRTALLDFILAVLEGKGVQENRQLILAIDEPEISLDASKRMAQFDKLMTIVGEGVSVIFTSHWYGWVANVNTGYTGLIDEDEEGKRVIELHRNSSFPFRDIPRYEMRMIFDFLIGLGSSAESNPDRKFVICEGESDALYLEASLNEPDYRFLAVRKAGVKKIADIFKDYHWKRGAASIRNVIFMIDTDTDQKDEYGNPFLRRWTKGGDSAVSLKSGSENFNVPCVIEDALDAGTFA
ncbi:MAG: hypothetical protein B7X03_03560 [Parcubacteria group bacterium 21-58-10]|nr:MAG: hypothetical protein B7X03_03560 [Parcubacteria group bacterium 21-58-10]